jgi:hypothetical protein
MGKTWSADALWDHGAMSMFSTITAIDESRLQEGLIYVGTDDGLIQVTEDGGKSWRKADKIAAVPDSFFVNKIKASKHDKDTVFAAVDSHKAGDYKPYLLKSTDRGKTWVNIAGDLPQRNIVWSFTQDHIAKDLLFGGTEFGIYVTLDGGSHWLKLGGGVPAISFRDIDIHEREVDLVGASFGRGFFILDDYSPLRQMSEELLQKGAALFPVKKALQYIPLRPIDSSGKGCLGDGFFLAPNPPFGAVFTYYLKDSLKTGAEARQEEEKSLEKAGKPVPFPSWDKLRKEEAEEKPEVVLTISDESGQVVRRITGPVSQGVHRIAWNLRYPPIEPIHLEVVEREEWDWNPEGPLVVPGKFAVSLAKKVEGVLTPLGEPQTFAVESLGMATLPEKDRQTLLDFQKRAGELQRAMMGAGAAAREASESLRYMKKALMETPKANPQLLERAKDLEKRLQDATRVLWGDRTVRRRSEAASPGLMQRVSAQLTTTCPITETAKRDYEIAAGTFEKLLEDMRVLIDQDVKKLEDELEAAGAPWTPGRRLPVWKKN